MKPSAVLPTLFGLLVLSIKNVVAQNGSALHCAPYIPIGEGYKTPYGSIEISGDLPSTYGYPGNPMTTKGNFNDYRQGNVYNFFVRSCNSTSLGLQRHREEAGGCTTDYLQFINTVTGNCMTWEKNTKDQNNVGFLPCVHTPNTSGQLFSAVQCDEFPDDPELLPVKNQFKLREGKFVAVGDVNGHDGVNVAVEVFYHPVKS